MTTVHFNFSDSDFLKKLVKLAFPGYKGRKLRVNYGAKRMNLRSYWDGGSRSTFVVVNMANMTTASVPNNHPVYDKQRDMSDVKLDDNFVVVEHIIFRGKDLGIKIHTPHDAPMVTDGETLTEIETNILLVTASRKSSYNGIKDYRAYTANQKWGYSLAQINKARDQLISKGYLSKRKAITNKGRNVIENHPKRYSV